MRLMIRTDLLFRGFSRKIMFFKKMKLIFKHFWREIRAEKFVFLGAMGGVFMAVATEVSYPFVYKKIAALLSEDFSPEKGLEMAHLFGILMFIYAGMWLTWRIFEFFLTRFESRGMRALEQKCFSVVVRQKMDFFENSFSGSLVRRAGKFVRAFEVSTDWFFFWPLNNGLKMISTLIIFAFFEPLFAVLLAIWAVIFLTGNILFARWKMKFDMAVAETDSQIGGAYADAFSHIVTVKSFSRENAEENRITKMCDDLLIQRLFAWKLQNINYGVQAFLMFGIELILVFLMIEKWKVGAFSVEEFVFFQIFIFALFHSLWDFGRNLRTLFTAFSDAQEMAEIFENGAENFSGKQFTAVGGKISFQNVSFGYDKTVTHFENFSLEIPAGQKVGLVGESGAGKTTIAKMLFRFSEISDGKIFIDNENIAEISLSELRKNISLVPQNPELFHRSVRENIAFSGDHFSDEEIWEVAKKARAAEFLEKLPAGLDTLVGERGVKLSGGERQRIAIARAFLENAPIVILDEATSALDSITERKIQAAIFELLKEKTAIVIAHRLSTILQMDRILVLEDGNIVEDGSHRELLAKKGKYEKLWQHQSGDFFGE